MTAFQTLSYLPLPVAQAQEAETGIDRSNSAAGAPGTASSAPSDVQAGTVQTAHAVQMGTNASAGTLAAWPVIIPVVLIAAGLAYYFARRTRPGQAGKR